MWVLNMEARFKPRFFCAAAIEGDQVCIDGSEHQHMTKVLRLKQGESVTLFDGSGKEFEATISDVGRNSTRLAIEAVHEADRELVFDLTLGVALPKGDRQQWLVEKCVELGVSRLTPLVATRGVAQPQGKALDRLRRWIVSASKQCRRNRLMDVTPAETVDQFASKAADSHVLWAHPDPHARLLAEAIADIGKTDSISIAIGPEGGFTFEEVAAAKSAGCQIVTLGDRILRIETAAIAIAASLVLGRTQAQVQGDSSTSRRPH